MSLEPKIVGKWDGHHLWIQWNDAAPQQGYAIQARYSSDGKKWTPWIRVGGPGAWKPCWIKIPTWKEGWVAQAQVALFSKTPEWEPAEVAEFDRSAADFSISNSSNQKVTFVKGDTFHCQVDGEACAYNLLADVEISVGKTVRGVKMESVQSGGFNQLDAPGHFTIRPLFGVTIENESPSENDLMIIGGETVKMAALPKPDGPLSIALGRINHR